MCTSWDSESGVFTISVNGEIKATHENFKKGASLGAGGNLVIGQDQDIVGGKFSATQVYVGELYEINVWDYALKSTEVASLHDAGLCGVGSTEKDPIISYADLVAQNLRGALSLIDGSCPVPCEIDDGGEKCWKTEETIGYKGGRLGYLIGDLTDAKVACFANDQCKALTCSKKGHEMKCELKSSIKKPTNSKKKTSYTYIC